MTSSLKIRDLLGWTMFIFGVLALLFGSLGLMRAEVVLSLLGRSLLDRAGRAAGYYTLVFKVAALMAWLIMGVYRVPAILNHIKQFYRCTFAFRGVPPILFTTAVLRGLAPARFIGVGLWESTGANATGIALWRESRK